jgi:hypothetical protein
MGSCECKRVLCDFEERRMSQAPEETLPNSSKLPHHLPIPPELARQRSPKHAGGHKRVSSRIMSLNERDQMESVLLTHFIFSNLTDALRTQILGQMELYEFVDG